MTFEEKEVLDLDRMVIRIKKDFSFEGKTFYAGQGVKISSLKPSFTGWPVACLFLKSGKISEKTDKIVKLGSGSNYDFVWWVPTIKELFDLDAQMQFDFS